MATCAGCGRKRGFFGVYTWQQCHGCDSYFCATCFGQLASVESEPLEWTSRECSQCGASILAREAFPDDSTDDRPW